jgi:hypothetical protein
LPKPSRIDKVNVNWYFKTCTTLYSRITSDKATLSNIAIILWGI